MTVTLGVDLGGTNTRVVQLNDGVVGDVLVDRDRDPAIDIVEHMIPIIERQWTDEVEAVGVGAAGLVSWPDGVFRWGPHVAGTEIAVRSRLEDRLGIPVAVDNDANTALLAEARLGTARGTGEAVLVALGTGIGGAIIGGGRIQRGVSFAGEFGHLILDEAGAPCECGKAGCWETMVSGSALERLAATAAEADPALAEAVATGGARAVVAIAAGGGIARELVEAMGEDLGRGISWLITALDPEIVVIGGGLSGAGDLLLDPARRYVAEHLHGAGHRTAPPIVVAQFGELAGAVGAALLAADRIDAP